MREKSNEELADQIRLYWAKRGHLVEVEVIMRAGERGIRSNLVGGLPPSARAGKKVA